MSKERAIELGKRAYEMEGDARWAYGDALVEYGWTPGDDRSNNGGLAIIEAFRSDLGTHVDIHMLPDASTLRQYATAARVFSDASREGLGIWVAYEAVLAAHDSAPELVAKIWQEKTSSAH